MTKKNTITLEKLAPQVTFGKPYIIRYGTVNDVWEIGGEIILCENVTDIMKIASDEITTIYEDYNGECEFDLNLGSTIKLYIFNMGRYKDSIIIDVYGLNESDTEKLENYLTDVIQNLSSD